MVALYDQEPAEEFNVGSVNLSEAFQGRRAMSASPVKSLNRASLPSYLTSGKLAELSEDLSSMFSTASVSKEQLRELSRSPISRKLHISKNNYAIPIPFTLQLPPRLSNSAPSTPNSETFNVNLRPKSPSRMIFTGKCYEPVYSEPEDGYEDYEYIHRATHTAPVADKPPSVTSSRKKVAKFVQKTQSIPLDQLSMIEEAPTRDNSVNSKALSVLPASPVSAGPSISLCNSKPTNIVHGQKITTEVHGDAHRKPEDTFISGVSAPLALWSRLPEKSHIIIPQTTTYLHNLNNGTGELRIDKRSFSDESRVSSVSSFSSVGDFFNVNAYAYSLRARSDLKVKSQLLHHAPQQAEQRNTSGSSEISQSSWNSVQKSLDFNLKDTLSNETGDLGCDETYSNEMPTTNIDKNDTIDASFLPLNIVTQEKSALLVEKEVDETNNGAGIGFNFPNDASNVTNKKSLKRNSGLKNARAGHSSYSLMSSTGQIEIPDLVDLSIQQKFSRPIKGRSSVSSARSSDNMEPIGMPSRAARDHFKSMCGDTSTESDSDSSFNSQFSKLNKATINKAQLSPVKKAALNKSPRSIVSSLSPIRHVRHRSMYNIDFDSFEPQVSPERKHSRSRSTADLAAISNSLGSFKLDQGPGIVATNREDKSEHVTIPNIVVAEPPKKIEYAVDFKTANKIPENKDMFRIKAPIDYYKRPTISTYSHYDYRNAGNSEVSSSYQSSRTAKETASTAPTDTNSVVIDLTKDGYNICMIKRNDSQLSYRSVIEKTKDGRDVEVVLVDEDDEADKQVDRDDLLSIYSRYMKDWAVRSSSVRSSASEASTATANSWTNSETTFQVKSMASIRRAQAFSKAKSTIRPSVGQKPKLAGGITEDQDKAYLYTHSKHLQGHQRGKILESNYFDYTAGDNYDFNTLMDQRKSSGIK